MTLELHDTVTICGEYLSALINNDFTGLADDAECRLVEKYAEALPPCASLDVKVDAGPQFAECAISGLSADCYEVDIYAYTEEV